MSEKNDRHSSVTAITNDKLKIQQSSKFEYTLFKSSRAEEMKRLRGDFAALCRILERAKPCEKNSARMIKLATFSGEPTARGCLRSDAALQKITGVEGDYDGGVITPEQAIERLQRVNLRAIVSTTHSHTPEAPRWRVFAPLSAQAAPGERPRLLKVLDEVLGNILAPESKRLSQAYYIGRPLSGEYKVLVTCDDPNSALCLDQLKGHVGKSKSPFAALPMPDRLGERKAGGAQLLDELLAGEDVHGNAMRIVGAWVAKGLDDDVIRLAMESVARRVAKARDKERASCLLGGELTRLIAGARLKGFGPKLPTLLPDGLPKVLPFDPEMLPPAIRGFVMDVADRQQSPPDFVAVASICGLSALIGRKALIRPKQHDDWTVTPNQWGAIIGRPSAMKSPSMKEALKPLRNIEEAAGEEFKQAFRQHGFKAKLAEIEAGQAQKAAERIIKAQGDREEALDVLAAAGFEDALPVRQRLIVNDATVEKLGELFTENPNGLILVRDELFGWISRLMQEEFQSERAFFLECFDGDGRYVFDRIKRGTVEIKNCTLSIVGGIQPSKISLLVRGALRGTADDGLVQRLQLSVWPDDVGRWKWTDRAPDALALEQYQSVVETLSSLNVASDDGAPLILRFSGKAQKLFISWMEDLQLTARSEDIHPALESHLIKMPQTIAGLALTFELLDGGRKAVREAALQRAIKWAMYLQSHAERLYSILKCGDVEGAKLILKRRKRLRETFTAREVQRKGWTGLDNAEVVSAALECLEEHHYVSVSSAPTAQTGGRPTFEYRWNPAIEIGRKGGGLVAQPDNEGDELVCGDLTKLT